MGFNFVRHLSRPITFGQRNARQSVLASAALVSIQQLKKVAATTPWQHEAWERYDQVCELRYGTGWLSNACSRTRLYVGKIDANGSSEPLPIEDGDPAQLPLDELFGGQVGHSEMLRRLAIQLNVPGESYLCGFDQGEGDDKTRRWICASSDEIDRTPTIPRLKLPEIDETVDLDPATSTVIRLWRPHPRYAWQADSPVRGLRGPLKQLLDLDAHVAATAQSRLAGAGILFIPDSATLAMPTGSDSPNPTDTDPFIQGLIEGMITPLNNPDSAAAVVPIVCRIPAEAKDAVQHITFSTPFDQRVDTLREAAIRRVATGLDIPPEVLLGMGDVNHWSAWAIEESAIKLHVEPMLGLICDALTVRYFRPALAAMGIENIADYAIWFDTSDIVMRANKGPDAMRLYEQGLINADAARRENGFSDEDQPDEEQSRNLLATRLALGNSQLAPYLLSMLGIDVPGLPINPTVFDNPEVGPRAPDPAAGGGGATSPALGGPPLSGPNAQGQIAASAAPAVVEQRWMTATVEIAALRALERAGKWLLGRSRAHRGRYGHVPPAEMHLHVSPQSEDLDVMLEGAFSELREALPDVPCVHTLVEDYVRFLLISGRQHQRADLVRALAASGCRDAA